MNEESGNPPSNLNDQNRTQKEGSGDQWDNSMNMESVEDHGDKLNAASSDQLGETNEEKASTHIYYFLLLAAFMDLVYIAILKREKLSALVLEGNWKMALVKEPIVVKMERCDGSSWVIGLQKELSRRSRELFNALFFWFRLIILLWRGRLCFVQLLIIH